MSPTAPVCLCVLGAPRSGATLVSRALEACGVAADEASFVAGMNERVLAAVGASWREPPSSAEVLDDDPRLLGLRDEARRWVSEREAEGRPWLMADPCLALTLPFWKGLSRATAYVLCVRNPEEVARSLTAGFGLDAATAKRLWLRYTRDALLATNRHPRHFTLFAHDAAAARGQLEALAAFATTQLGVPCAPATSAFEPSRVHYTKFLRDAIDERRPSVEGVLFSALAAASTGGEVRDEALSSIAKRLRPRRKLEQLHDSRAKLQRRVAALETELTRSEQARARAEWEVLQLTSSRAWKVTEPLRAGRRVAGSVVRGVRRRRFALTPEASFGVAALGAEAFRTEGDDPQLILTSSGKRYPYGWVLFSATFKADPRLPRELTLFPDYGAGFAPERAVRLHPDEDGRVSAVLYLERNLRAWRIDPTAGAGDFTLADVSATEITALEAFTRLGEDFAKTRRLKPRDLVRLSKKSLQIVREEGPRGLMRRLRGEERSVIDGKRYETWVKNLEALSSSDEQLITRRIAAMARKPTFSVLMPVYDVEPRWLSRAIDSVRAQLYPHWELCIADDASPRADVRECLTRYAAQDARIKVVFRPTNGHISEASNSALSLATGEMITLLDHDDELPRHALYMVAEELQEHPDAGLLYSDEDKIDESGRRYDPYFKPDWNPDLFTSHNMVSHLGTYRRKLVQEVGGFRRGFEGAQDYDLALRVSERLEARQIRHIPHVLYHWRSLSTSTASGADAKDYATLAARRAVTEHFERRKIAVEVTEASPGSSYHRVRYRLPDDAPLVSIIIPTKNRVELVTQAVDSITKLTTYPRYEILIVDNQSDDPVSLRYFRELEAQGRAQVLRYDQPFNFAAINNFAARQAEGDVLVLLNNDIEVITPRWLEEMVSHALRPDIGCVGAMLYYPDDRIQHAGVILGIQGVAGHCHRMLKRGNPGYFSRAALLQNLSAVTAACLAVRHEVYDEVGGLDEQLKVAFNDVDFCLRVRERGYHNLWTPYAELYHHESASRGSDTSPENRERFARETAFMKERWGDALIEDPAYNPNLSLIDDQFSLAVPPRAVKPWRTMQQRDRVATPLPIGSRRARSK